MVLNMKKIDEKKLSLTLLTGAVGLVLLIFLMGMNDFSKYFVDTVIWLLISSFFVIPIVKTVANQKFDRNDTIPFILGFIGSWFYSYFSNFTLFDWSILVLQTLIVVTVLSVIIVFMKEELRVGN